ncbi:MAG: Ig-like domain-containing protein, partial [Pseudomonadota bacterium]
PDGDPLTVTAVGAPANGTVVINADGTVTYTPNPGFTGGDSFTYTVSDGNGGVTMATVTVDVTATPTGLGGQPPVADQALADGETPAPLDLSTILVDPDGDPLTFSATGLPPGLSIDPMTGVISGTVDGSASQGGPNLDGLYTAIITATDGGAPLTIAVSYTITNPAPVAADDALTTDQNTALNGDVLAANPATADSDIDGDTLSVTRVAPGTDVAVLGGLADGVGVGGSVAGSAGGVFTVEANGAVTFDPGTDFIDLLTGQTRTTSIVYQVDDGEGGADTAVVTVTVVGVTEDLVLSTSTPNPDGTLIAMGTGQPGAEITVTFPNGEVVVVIAGPAGTYTAVSTTPQSSGDIVATQTDALGNFDGPETLPYVDVTAPLPPTFSLAPNPNGTLTATGAGEPWATITIIFPNGEVIETTVGEDGTYTATSETPQSSGDITVIQTDKDGNAAPPVTVPYVDTMSPLPPVITTFTENIDDSVTITGTGEPGSTVTVKLPGGATIETTVDADGMFSVTVEGPFDAGAFCLLQTDEAGNTSEQIALPFEPGRLFDVTALLNDTRQEGDGGDSASSQSRFGASETARIDNGLFVVRAANEAGALNGLDALTAKNVVVQTVNSLSSLGAIEESAADEDAAIGAGGRDRAFGVQQTPELVPGYSSVEARGLGAADTAISIDTYSRDGVLFVEVFSIKRGETATPMRDIAATLSDGRALPSWVDVDRNGVIMISRPADLQTIGLRITGHSDDGAEVMRYVSIDTVTGELREASQSSSPFARSFSAQLEQAGNSDGESLALLQRMLRENDR